MRTYDLQIPGVSEDPNPTPKDSLLARLFDYLHRSHQFEAERLIRRHWRFVTEPRRYEQNCDGEARAAAASPSSLLASDWVEERAFRLQAVRRAIDGYQFPD